ncbi:MAG TPA: malectin domain-containing carbohydrate-binding protein [Bryobacteraceae bacterium]|nr:malectin domain-containing carbohydrate-binding protein [Bryobacteraceae bacterium]
MRAAGGPDHVPGRLVVGHRREADAGATDRTLRAHHATIQRYVPELRMSVLEVPEEQSDDILAALQQSGMFEYVERDYYARTGSVTPSDPDYSSQWYLPQILAPAAWGVTTGSASVVVAVIDSGVDGTHPDLSSKLVAGWNFVGNNSNTSDVLGHGTAVAGTLAAASNNGIGVAGVSWKTMMMPLVVVDASDYASYSNMAAAIQYAADHGAQVINLSLGGSTASAALQSAVNYAWGKGVTLFAAAMNNSSSTPQYPAACTNVVAVSATDVGDVLASFSDYGSWITLSAPGNNILTTVSGGGYGYWYGTSFASPIAAGVAALALAVDPALGNAALVNLLEQNSDQVGGAGFSTSFGWGRVNAYRAVTAAQNLLAPATVSISPLTAALSAGQTQQFTPAIVGGSNLTVTWSLSLGAGTIANGLYTAPATIGTVQTVTVTATLSTGAHATATITLTPPATTTTATPPFSPISTFTPIRVNAGGMIYTDPSGNTWAWDYDYIGGNTSQTSATVAGTTASPLYQTSRWGNFSYQFAVPNGSYTVTLKFAELYFASAGSRRFNVNINGTPVLTNFDIVAQAGGALKALDESFPVTVTNGQIGIQFTPGAADQPMVNAIEIDGASITTPTTPAPTTTSTPATAVFRVNAGGGAYTDSSGNVWSGDYYNAGGGTSMTSAAVSGTTTPVLYQTDRWGTFHYNVSVANGPYTVNLKFAEIYFTTAGSRMFNVSINGTPVLPNFDIVAQAGGAFKALDESIPVTVTNGQINIQFTPGVADQPTVNAIEILMN